MSPREPDRTQVLLITGPAGSGKSTLTWEIAARLGREGIAHATIESDELDRVFPLPTEEELEAFRPGTTDVSSLNLAAIWATYRAPGCSRLIMSGVMLYPEDDRLWITAAIPEAAITVVRLRATAATLLARLDRREVGSGRDDQFRRSLHQAEQMAGERVDGLILVPVDDATPINLADRVLRAVGWLEGLAVESPDSDDERSPDEMPRPFFRGVPPCRR